tara:strand:- start:47 stop:520 length:474 start_codon:yes stop_codon:yes gene_type:complete
MLLASDHARMATKCRRIADLVLTAGFVRGTRRRRNTPEVPEVAKPEWGVKRVCLACGARFYDMQKSPIVCPSCDTQFDPEAIFRPRRARAEEATAAPAAANDDAGKKAASEEDEVAALVDDVDVEDDDADDALAADLDDDDDEEEVVVVVKKDDDES